MMTPLLLALALTAPAPTSPTPHVRTLNTGVPGLSAQLITHGDLAIPVLDDAQRAALAHHTFRVRQGAASDLEVPPARVNARLRLTNTRDQPVAFRWGGDGFATRRELRGPGAARVLIERDLTEIFFVGQTVVIPPGASQEIPLGELTTGERDAAHAWYALRPGQYELKVSLDARLELNADPERPFAAAEGDRATIQVRLPVHAG